MSKAINNFKVNPPIKCAILASGSGTNAENLIKYSKENPNKIKIECVISDKADAKVLERAKKLNVPSYTVIYDKKEGRVGHEKKILKVLKDYDVYFVLLAGYMRILTPTFLSAYNNTKNNGYIINIHPSYLPEFKGAHAFLDAFNANVPYSGITVHLVCEAIDSGKILLQEKFERKASDTFEDFYKRGRSIEEYIYKNAIDKILNNEIVL
ncbi:MAG: phosphoribosylglycinamide formyltransferase [Bacteriovoracaceae bacterium]